MSAPEGLNILLDVVSESEEREIITWLDSQKWSEALKRRTQHYGFEYNYKSRSVYETKPMSGPILDLAGRFTTLFQLADVKLDQCIVNEYYRNQGISPHVDAKMFGRVIIGLSLGAPANMIFTRDNEKYTAYLPQRSLLLMTGAARNEWKHSISSKIAMITSDGSVIKKQPDYRRISLTYRTINPEYKA